MGDWLAVAARPDEGRGTIHAVLPRKSAFIRKTAFNETKPQVLAANVDVVFIVAGSTTTSTSAASSATSRSAGRAARSRWCSSRRQTSAPRSTPASPKSKPSRSACPCTRWPPRAATVSRQFAPTCRPAGRPRAARLVRRRQVDARERARRRGDPRDAARARGRQRRPAHDDAPRAGAPARRRHGSRHARDARAAALGRGRGHRSDVRRRRGARRAVPLHRLRQRRRARLCRARRAIQGGELDKERFDSWQKLQRELEHLA